MGKFNTDVGKINLDINQIFGSPKEESDSSIQEIGLDELQTFRDHPFHVKDDDDMKDLERSVREREVLVPGIARPRPQGGYELVSGHRRKRACELAGRGSLPVIVRELTDEEAVNVMVDTNLQRTKILPSEKAFAYKMKMEAMSHQGKKGGHSADSIGQVAKDSARTVYRYIRLTRLIPALLQLVDDGKITLGAGDALSGLSEENQTVLSGWIAKNRKYPNEQKSCRIKDTCDRGGADGKGLLDEKILDELFAGRPKARMTLSPRIQRYFAKGTSTEEMEAVIIRLLEREKNAGN